MNDIIKIVHELGWSKTLYDIFFVLGFVSVFLFVVLFGKKIGIKPLQSILTVLIVYPIVVLWMFVMFWIESGFRDFGGNNIVRIFVYVPLVAYPVAKLLKIPYGEMCSMLSLGPASVHAVSHIGCIFSGCCRGYPCSWGLYNSFTDDIRFPIQLIEVFLAWLILFYLLLRAKKRKYVPDGFEYPMMLVMFGTSRFVCEFMRDNEKIWLGCSSLAFHALFMAVVGLVWILIKKKQINQTRGTNN